MPLCTDKEADIRIVSLKDLYEEEIENINDEVNRISDFLGRENNLSLDDPLKYEAWLKAKAYSCLMKKFGSYNFQTKFNENSPVHMWPYQRVNDDIIKKNIAHYSQSLDNLRISEFVRIADMHDLERRIRDYKEKE